jgi:hypothetical protein
MAAASSPAIQHSQLDVVFDGTWILVPSVDAAGNISGVDVYSPDCGHPHGAVFLNQLGPFSAAAWPAASSLYMLEEHSHCLDIQRTPATQTGMKIGGIDKTVNHCLAKFRPIGGNWDLLISIAAGPNAWVSSDTMTPQTTDSAGNTVPCFTGADIPTGKVSAMQTLTFLGVTGVEFCGAPAKVQALFPSPWSGTGSLIVEGELPYIPTFQHIRSAYDSMAALAGLDLAMINPLPRVAPVVAPQVVHPMLHTGANCGHSLIVMPK